ncbi:MAG: hypothetical protein IJ523_09690 [Succinivibrionaceae bacterium]|nr:hypothetical protein [Succinivibrionaceae bacterium]
MAKGYFFGKGLVHKKSLPDPSATINRHQLSPVSFIKPLQFGCFLFPSDHVSRPSDDLNGLFPYFLKLTATLMVNSMLPSFKAAVNDIFPAFKPFCPQEAAVCSELSPDLPAAAQSGQIS